MLKWPVVIQGGMGVYISTPFLAKAVAQRGGLGTVSGVAADKMMARILQAGDPDGHFRRALSHFPYRELARKILDEYFVPGGIPRGAACKPVPAITLSPSRLSIALLVCANFAFVWLAKEGHPNPVSINWLEKMQMNHLYSIAGAMLADVDVVTMGAGIPLQIPGVLDALADGHPAEYQVTVTNCPSRTIPMRFDPHEFFGHSWPNLRRPDFLPIVSSDSLARWILKRASGTIQGFVVEEPTAGGHNAPPRSKLGLSESGEPMYGPQDKPDFEKMKGLGIPFWVGGSYASPAGLARALSVGAHGIQVGSIFALGEDSGMDPRLRREIIHQWHDGKLRVKQDPSASPTGFPFQVAQLPGTLAEETIYRAQHRHCNQHGLTIPIQMHDGTIGYRCSAEPIRDYLRKEGDEKDTSGARCLCNGLIATSGLGDPGEIPIVTLGSDLSFLRHLTQDKDGTYTVDDVMNYLQGPA